MMDGRAMFPRGWHPQSWLALPDGVTDLGQGRIPSRTAAGTVRYYYIDFGISSLDEDTVLGIHGQERAPELSDTKPYNPFKLDVYILGMAFSRLAIQVSHPSAAQRLLLTFP